jgi:dephospho-CoA kinase
MAAKIIGLTGPIASGKNEVARLFRRHRACVIEVDRMAHTLYAPQTSVWRQLIKRFGTNILVKGGKINRVKLAKIVFADAAALKFLNQVVHPLLYDLIHEEITLAQARGEKIIVVNAALLKEIGLEKLVEEVWVVMAKAVVRRLRLLKNGLTPKEVRQRLASQRSTKDYLAGAAVILDNNATLTALKKKFEAAYSRFCVNRE